MERTQTIRCPNCGSVASRKFIDNGKLTHSKDFSGQTNGQIIRTECPVCDYLMIMHSINGSVLEAYAPGISTGRSQRFEFNSSMQGQLLEAEKMTDAYNSYLFSSVMKS